MTKPAPGTYLRRAGSSQPVPAGWDRCPAGALAGVALEVVFRPDRHDLCRASAPLGDKVEAGLAGSGWQRTAALDAGVELWVRDRHHALGERLAALQIIDGGRGRSR